MADVLRLSAGEDNLEQGLISSIQSFFPFEGKKNVLVAKRVYTSDRPDREDIKGQLAARDSGRIWGYSVYGDFEVRDKATGKLLGNKDKIKLASVPMITPRFSYIVGGTEYQADKQWRLKSGVYTREREDGSLETQFNVEDGAGFRLNYDPKDRKFILAFGTKNIPLYPALQALGVSDSELRNAWGDEILNKNKQITKPNSLKDLAERVNPRAPRDTDVQAAEAVRTAFTASKLRPDTTNTTLGTPFANVSGGALLSGSKKLLAVHRGESPVDSRDSLAFKELWGLDDHLPERVKNSRRNITRQLGNNIDRHTDPTKIVNSSMFGVPVKHFFVSTNLAQTPTQSNPLDMINGHLRTTIMGPGGISTDQAVTFDAKLIDPSHLGILDPVATPEGSRTGITLHLGTNVDKVGREAALKVYDLKNNKIVTKTAGELANSVVAFPDGFTWSDGKPSPVDEFVKVSNKGEMELVKPADAEYVITSSRGMFSLTSNMIPFLPSVQANRAEMATRHLEQAISLKNREAPLVQVKAGGNNTLTYERIVGKFASHLAPVNGVVQSVQEDKIVIKGEDGKRYNVQRYQHYPLNSKKAFIHSEPLVKVGDAVKQGDTVADTNFTKDGVLALGTNLRIAFLPFRGLTFEDGIVVSESAAQNKLVSSHLYKPRVFLERNMEVNLNKFRSHHPGVISDENAEKLDNYGVIKEGMIVKPGDVLIAALTKRDPNTEQVLLRGIHKSLVNEYKDSSVSWDHPTTGVVTGVVRNGREITVRVATDEPATVGDKLSGRFGNKGVITAVLPDEEMPKDKDGNAIEIVVNPSGVPGRINTGQIHETRLAKIAAANGETYAVANFEPNDRKKLVKVPGHFRTVKTSEGEKQVWIEPYEYERDYEGMVAYELRKNGMTGEEELFDGDKSLGKVMTGHMYILKLLHQINKKVSARGQGAGYEYDANMIPKGGSDSGAQRYGGLGVTAMLAHGATASIQEGLTYKSDRNQSEAWIALQNNLPMPTPQTSFATEKFFGYLYGLGVNVEKRGNDLTLVPLTDEQILEKSNGKLTDPTKVLRGKDLRPEKGGLFDEEITGGPGGSGWSHIELNEPMPNPLFERAIVSLLGVRGKDFKDVMAGKAYISERGEMVSDPSKGFTGPEGIVRALGNVNVADELSVEVERVKTARRSELNAANRRLKYLTALHENNLTAKEAYTLKNIPVLPPAYRPISMLEGGDLSVDGVNQHYREVALLNDSLEYSKGLPQAMRAGAQNGLYSAIAGLMGSSTYRPGQLLSDGKNEAPPGILDIIAGRGGPKHGYFLSKVVDKKQDTTMRSVIVPDLSLGLDEVGVPRGSAMTLFSPFVVKELRLMGISALDAREEIAKNSDLANKALDNVVANRPVQFKRDPVLFKYGIQGFNVKLIDDDSAIHIHPLTVGGFNADFDGDTMSIFVPVSDEAIEETKRMMPSRNIFNPGTGRTMYTPSLEGQLGLFLLTQTGKETGKKFGSFTEAIKALKSGEVDATDVVTVKGIKTTPGKVAFYETLPEFARSEDMLTSKDFVLNSRKLNEVMAVVGREGTPAQFAKTSDKIKDLGWGHAHNIGFSFTDADFVTLRSVRDKHLAIADKAAKKVLTSNIPKNEKDKKLVEIYSKATADMSQDAKVALSEQGSALFAMYSAGVKPGWAQLQQLVLAPMLLQNAKGETIPVPVTRSYTEGLDTAGYWIASSGARKGLIEKVQSVSKPGALNKQILNTTMHMVVDMDDCATDKGVSLPVGDSDVLDRVLAKPVKVGSTTYSAGTVVTPRLVSKLKTDAVSSLVVRSPMKCNSPGGVCSKCYGLTPGGKYLDKGTNIGIIAGQAVGERGTQLSMKQFHTGGVAVAGGSGNVVNSLTRVTQLLKMPANLPNQATLAVTGGTVSKVQRSTSGGWDVTIGTNTMYVPQSRELLVKEGDSVKKGAPISSGTVNPRELLDLTDIDRVRGYISDEIHKVYAGEGVKRRNVEVVTRALTNLGIVEDPGSVDGIVRGDLVQLNHIMDKNRNVDRKAVVTPVLKGIETLPLDQTEDWLARMHYRRQKDTIREGAARGWKSDIHGPNPIPGMVYNAEFGKSTKPERPY